MVESNHPVRINFSSVEEKIRSTKSAGSLRNYLGVVRRARNFFGSDELDLSNLTAETIEDFRNFMATSGDAPSSVANYMMIFRALMKDYFGANRQAFKRVFANVKSVNNAPTNLADFDDLQILFNSNLDAKAYLIKIRFVFLYAFFCGGLRLEQLKTLVQMDYRRNIVFLPYLEKDFYKKTETSLPGFIDSLSEDNYANALSLIGNIAKTKHKIKPESAATVWASTASKLSIPIESIDSVSCWQNNLELAPSQEVVRILEKVGGTLMNVTPKWFALRCKNESPESFASRLKNVYRNVTAQEIETFIPPKSSSKNQSDGSDRLMESLLFFKTDLETAKQIRKDFFNDVWVYSQVFTKVPIQISDNEMRIFMFLCHQSNETIAYHFGDSAISASTLSPGQMAEVVYGSFKGHIGVISATPAGSYNVVMRIPAISGYVTATIPAEFLRLV